MIDDKLIGKFFGQLVERAFGKHTGARRRSRHRFPGWRYLAAEVLESRALLSSSAAVHATAPAPPVLGDAGFEAVNVGNSYQYGPKDPGGWKFTQLSTVGVPSGSGVSGNGSPFTDLLPPTPEGTQVAFIQGLGTISQTVGNWGTGWYTISFDAAQRANWGSAQNFAVQVDGRVVGTFRPATRSYLSYATDAFFVGAGTHVIKFAGLDTVHGDSTALIDAVAINNASPPTVPSLIDSGFEVVPVGNGYQYFPTDPSGWQFLPGPGALNYNGSGVTGNNSPFTDGLPPTPEGTQAALLQGIGTISQTVSNWGTGWYTISFDAAQRVNWGSSQNFAVQVDGRVVGTFRAETASYLRYTTNPFFVGAGTHVIKFAGLDTVHGDSTALIDAVAINNASPPTVPSVFDSGFEIVPVGNSYQYFPTDPSGWQFSPSPGSLNYNGSGVTGNNSPFTDGLPPTPEGTQAAFIQGIGTISQTVENWTTGWYTISFVAAQRANLGSIEDFVVKVDGRIVGTFRPAITSYLGYTTNAFFVAGGAHTIRFTGLNSAHGDSTAFIDAVAISVASI